MDNKRDFKGAFYKKPVVQDGVFLAPGSYIMGDVVINHYSSVWYGAVLRGDINSIRIGKGSNLQDQVLVHLENDKNCSIADYVTVGHRAILHGCLVESASLIGMGAIVLNGAHIQEGAVIAAGSVVKENTVIQKNELWAGVPARKIKELSNSYQENVEWAEKYIQLAKEHQKMLEVDHGMFRFPR